MHVARYIVLNFSSSDLADANRCSVTLFGLLGHWFMVGQPRYGRMEFDQTVPFISDLAAQKLWPLFLIGCFITTLFFNISFYQFVRQKEHHNNLCIYFSFTITIIGGLSLLMIGVFDNIDFKHLHDVFVTIFITGYIIGAVAICIDYFYLMTLYGAERRILFASFFIKVSFIITELAFILPFRIMAGMHHAEKNAAAVLEWATAFIFTGYVLSFAVDLMEDEDDFFHSSHKYHQLEMNTVY
ncbi:uncharacterized protein N7469_001195 [Penicillium citrinum]|uniref:CWH43-like N-terminal domain-containing protein n=1 Tax=Penicillium citrinum TaxID=5077 RepID=A0A9W9PEK5_PENCI|nr:uncharacterized protein N7469_001195 [Penicillium citrinum]KAJ5242868.1 hypothetical protein N7469_001195 [Penicillium citrinum]